MEKITIGNYTLAVKLDRDWDEWQIIIKRDRKQVGMIPCGDRQDAEGTIKVVVEEIKTHGWKRRKPVYAEVQA